VNNQIFYGDQRTDQWHKLRLGLFTSSTIYHLFEDSSKQAKATALMGQIKDGIWRPTGEVLNHRPTSDDMKYICDYLVKFKFLKALDVPFLKKDLKAALKGAVGELPKDCLLILTACYALQKIEVASGSMLMLCKKKAMDIIYEDTDEDLMGIDAIEWGIENEPLALSFFERNSLERLDEKEQKISFILNERLQTGSSPDATIDGGKIPVEVKNPRQRGIHYDHNRIKTADDLFAFDKQKYYQIQHQIWCLGAKYGFFASFDRRLLGTKFEHKTLHYIRIERNEKVMQQFEPRLLQAIEVRNKFINEF